MEDWVSKGIPMVSLFAGEVLRGHDQRLVRPPCRDGVTPADRFWRQVSMMGVQQYDDRAVI